MLMLNIEYFRAYSEGGRRGPARREKSHTAPPTQVHTPVIAIVIIAIIIIVIIVIIVIIFVIIIVVIIIIVIIVVIIITKL